MRHAPPPGVREAIARALDHDANETTWTRAGGSALNAIWRVDAGDVRHFIKVGERNAHTMYEAEAAGLRALESANAVRVPQVIATGLGDDHAWLALEWLDLEPGGRDASLGRALAALHRVTAPRFGWERDNTIGTTPQANAWDDDWPRFFATRRLAPQLRLAARNGHRAVSREGERLIWAVPALLAGHAPEASLLHGDLWSGNAACTRHGAPVIFDPATYFGDRETDLAMTELFGGFAPSFHAAYRDAWPLDEGYAVRRTLYNLYHVLNHLNLFGAAYAAQARQMIARLVAEAGPF